MHKPVVLDASILVAFITSESAFGPHKQTMADFIDAGTPFLAPDLLVYEIVNVVSVAKKFTKAQVREVLLVLDELQITYIPLHASLLALSLDMQYAYKLTFYDACYAGVAVEYHASLFTLDAQLRKVKGITVI
jgi:predicted nucleic acid-binding protein